VDEPIGLPILFDGEVTEEDRRHLHFGEVGLEAGELVTAGYHGWTMVVTGVADTIPAAQAKAYALADRVVVPNLRYRRDIGDKLVAGDLARVERLGLFGADSNSLRGGEGRPGGPG
jgi:phosphoribosylamine---glycine ligase